MVVLGIDLGSLNSVIATVQRGAVTVVTTELSERFTPSLVGFTEERRLLGDHAAAQLKSNAKNTCRYFRNVLGEPYEESCACQAKERTLALGNLGPVPPNNVLGYKVQYRGKEETFSAECVTAAFLTKLKQVAEGNLRKKVSEVVVACPSWFRDCNRTALLNATQIAGLSCLRIISDMAATALDYGMYRRSIFSNEKPHIVAFVGVGHTSTSACVVAFWSDRLRLLAEVSDRELGARDFCYEIMKHFAAIFQRKTGDDPLKNLKARLKLEDQAMRAQKILSANSETHFHVECLMGDNDCSGQLTRAEFEELCSHKLLPRMEKLFQRALEQSGIRREELASVEITGGGTRIPWVQRCVADTFKRDISRTLSADETVARGCALQAAMASLSFRVKEYAFGERCLFPIAICWADGGPAPAAVQPVNGVTGQPVVPQQAIDEAGGPPAAEKEKEAAAAAAPHTTAAGEPCILIPPGTDANTLYKITFFRRGPFTLKAIYNDLPPTSRRAQLDICHIKLTPTVEPQEVQVYAELNYYGLVRFGRICVKQRREEEEEVPVVYPRGTAASGGAGEAGNAEEGAAAAGKRAGGGGPGGGAGAAAGGPEAEGAAAAAGEATAAGGVGDAQQQQQHAASYGGEQQQQGVVMERRRVQRVVKVDVPFEVEPAAGRTTAQQLQQYREAELNMENDDRVACEKMERINEVETYMYTLRDALQQGGKICDFASGEEKRKLEQLYESTQQWIENVMVDIGNVSRSAILQKLQQLHEVGDRVNSRYEQFHGRKEAEQSLTAAITEARLACQSQDEAYAHIPVAEKRRVHDFAEHTENWLSEVMAKQHTLPPYADPVITVEDIEKRREELIRLTQKVFSLPKARPPAAQPHHQHGADVAQDQQHSDMQAETNAENLEGDFLEDDTKNRPKIIPVEDPDAPEQQHRPQQTAA